VWCVAVRADCPAGTYPSGYTTIEWDGEEGQVCTSNPPRQWVTAATSCWDVGSCGMYAVYFCYPYPNSMPHYWYGLRVCSVYCSNIQTGDVMDEETNVCWNPMGG